MRNRANIHLIVKLDSNLIKIADPIIDIGLGSKW